MYAVDSEYKNGLVESMSTIYNAISALAKKDHPFSKLMVGNYETINIMF